MFLSDGVSPMKPNRPPSGPIPSQKIKHLLDSGQPHRSVLRNLLDQAEAQVGWTRTLRAVLPESIRPDCRVIAVHGDALVIGCRSAAAATRLRFIAPEVLADLSSLADFSGITRIKVRISSG
jgi:hypothetical protein